MTRRERRAEGARLRKEGALDEKAFLEVAGQFIDLANRLNRRIVAPDVALVLQYAAARYAAHVAKNVTQVESHEDFVQAQLKAHADMLRQSLADPEL